IRSIPCCQRTIHDARYSWPASYIEGPNGLSGVQAVYPTPTRSAFTQILGCHWSPKWSPTPRHHHQFRLLSHLPLGRAVYLRPAELHALRNSALQTCFDPSINVGTMPSCSRLRGINT